MIKRKLFQYIVWLLKAFLKKRKRIVYHSFPDFSDNSFAAYVYANKNLKDYNHVWLVDDYTSKNQYIKLVSNYNATNNLLILKKKSVKGIWYYLTTEIVFHTHGLYNFLGLIGNQKKINLWHGMPIKKIGYLDNPQNKNVQISNFHVATSSIYQKILAQAFGVVKEKVLITGQARNDFLFENHFSIHQLFDERKTYNKTILWMPTYRKSIIGDIRVDSVINKEDDFFTPSSLDKINRVLTDANSICYIKLHPMDYRKCSDFNKYSNIRFIDNKIFKDCGINMYSTFNSVDILLTDFSSIYIDFLLLDKPIGFVFSDYNEFSNTRGFLFDDTIKYMPGNIIKNTENLRKFLLDLIVDDNDSYKEERIKVKKTFHRQYNGFCKTLFDEVL